MRFDIEAIRERAIGARFLRGENYAASGAIDILEIAPEGVCAHVWGESGVYLVTVSEPDASDGRCSCADFGSLTDLCKHVIAVALTVEQMPDGEQKLKGGRLWRVREMLRLEDRDALVERIIALAKADPKVLAVLEGREIEEDEDWE